MNDEAQQALDYLRGVVAALPAMQEARDLEGVSNWLHLHWCACLGVESIWV
jgi:hypothetical protein